MFEDKIESIIREEVRTALAGIITKESFEAAVREAIADLVKPIVLWHLMNIEINVHQGDIYGCH